MNYCTIAYVFAYTIWLVCIRAQMCFTYVHLCTRQGMLCDCIEGERECFHIQQGRSPLEINYSLTLCFTVQSEYSQN